MNGWPLIELTGDAYTQGWQHGRALRDAIAANLRIYTARFERELRMPIDEVWRRARRYAAVIVEQNPDYAAGMRGIADGAGVELAAIAALNVRYELFYQYFREYDRVARKPDGCTAFALLPGATSEHHLLVGENWDWIVGARGAITRTVERDGHRMLAFTEAGIFGGKIGLNSAGLALLINGLSSADDNWSSLRRPFHVRCYEILRARTLAAAKAVITAEERAGSANFLLVQAPDQVVNIEAAPDAIALSYCVDECLIHANHFNDPAAMGVVERQIERYPHSQWRQARLRDLLAARPQSLASVQMALRDHESYPYSICFHIDPADPPDERYETVASIIMDVTDKTLYATDGPPCERAYVRYQL
ncbi:C45 family autoproteolytic acyltransferase/hydolase [Chloroflexus sp.]|uniref:C45 family autoproteolytic acyltransferase/hydolase n=1 Tax=Chloroflexus sp. TaxID=1904827 RepID=UPI002629C867|nr:C45 family peptidase [uncultured Chloroflexus sp.]